MKFENLSGEWLPGDPNSARFYLIVGDMAWLINIITITSNDNNNNDNNCYYQSVFSKYAIYIQHVM